MNPAENSSATTNSATTKEIALITGATSGIGLHLAREFASHGHPLVLVAPIPSELEDIAARLRTEFDAEIARTSP